MKKLRRDQLPEYLTIDQKSKIMFAQTMGKPVLVSGEQGPTGKTTLAELLRENGIQAFEDWECEKIILDSFIR